MRRLVLGPLRPLRGSWVRWDCEEAEEMRRVRVRDEEGCSLVCCVLPAVLRQCAWYKACMVLHVHTVLHVRTVQHIP